MERSILGYRPKVKLPKKLECDPYSDFFPANATKSTLTGHDQTKAEDLALASAVPPSRFIENFLNSFRSHYNQPSSQSLRLVRASRVIGDSQVVDLFIVICGSQDLRKDLSNCFLVRPSSKDESPQKPIAIWRGNSPVSFVRSLKRYVIDRLCHNLQCLKANLEDLVRVPESMNSLHLQGWQAA